MYGTYCVRNKILVQVRSHFTLGSDAVNCVYAFRLRRLRPNVQLIGATSNPLHEVVVLRNTNCDNACYSSVQITCPIAYTFMFECLWHATLYVFVLLFRHLTALVGFVSQLVLWKTPYFIAVI